MTSIVSLYYPSYLSLYHKIESDATDSQATQLSGVNTYGKCKIYCKFSDSQNANNFIQSVANLPGVAIVTLRELKG